MAKLDGRYAADAWKNPGLNVTISRKSTPIRGFSDREMAEYSLVSHAAHTKARTERMT